MSYTKQQYITDALDEIGIASYNFDLQPEQLQSALRKLDNMMAEWSANGLRVAYPLPSSPSDSNLQEECVVPDIANSAIIYNLAIRLCSSYGKKPSMELVALASRCLDNLRSAIMIVPSALMKGGIPLGAGNKPWRYMDNEFTLSPDDNITAGNHGGIII